MSNNDDASSLSAPLLPQLEKGQYGSSANLAVTIRERSPLMSNAKASLIVQKSSTIYKNGKPRIERYEIKIMSSSKTFAYPLSEGVWRPFKEFRWLRRVFLKQYGDQKIPCLPPNYLFRRNYDPEVVSERLKGLQGFLQECLQVKHIVSDLTFHLFVQSDLSIKDIKQQQQSNNNNNNNTNYPSLFTCFWVCRNRTQDNDDDIDYNEFKKELESVLKENEKKKKEDSTTEYSN